MANHAPHPLRRPRRGDRRPRRRFSLEVRQLGATTANLPEPLRGGLIGWLFELLLLLRRGRRATAAAKRKPSHHP